MVWEIFANSLDSFNHLVIGYYLLMNGLNTGLLFVSLWVAVRYFRKTRGRIDYRPLPHRSVPPVSLIRVAFNESASIVKSIRSLLNLNYPDYEVVVVHDGSKDETLKKLVEAFDLKPFDCIYRRILPTLGSIRKFYVNSQSPRIIVVDKENSGKADSLNVGINVAQNPYFCPVDADTVLERDALKHLIRPILEDPDRIVACGGIMRIANGCMIENGQVIKVNLPKDALSMFQIVEQIRCMLFGQIGWAALHCLWGSFRSVSLYQKKTVLKLGGYDARSVRADMDLMIRLKGLTLEQKRYCRVVMVMDQVAWAQSPHRLNKLARQRRNWHQGLVEALISHLREFMRLRYGVMRLLSLLLYTTVKMLGPVVEIGGYITIGLAWALGVLTPQLMILFLFLVFFYGMFLSMTAVLLEEVTYGRYPTWSHLFRLLFYASFENFGYRQLNSWWRFQAMVKFMLGWRRLENVEYGKVETWPVKTKRSLLVLVSSLVMMSTVYAFFYFGSVIGNGQAYKFIQQLGNRSSDLQRSFVFLYNRVDSMIDDLSSSIQNAFSVFPSMDQSFKFLLLLIFLLVVDGIKVVVEIIHRARPRHFTPNSDQVTALLPCHNSAGVIRNTIMELKRILPGDRIIVIDDASTDNTQNVAKNLGIQVYRFSKNKGKVAAINFGVYRVKTKYTLILDDDTRIGYAQMPTSLFDEGYTAVAFNLLPCRRGREIINGKNLLSCLQRYEYGKSMEIGKRFEDVTLSVSCISGAAGLFLTERLHKYHHDHSNVFAGEDLERTLKDLLRGGEVAFANENVWTLAPDNILELTRQRLFNWGPGFYRNVSNFFWILFSKDQPKRLKFEMAYNIYVVFSDPIKVYSLFVLLLQLNWQYLLAVYLTYLSIEIYPFIVVEKKLPIWRYYFPALLVYPIYGFYNTLLRFLSIFIWLWGRFVSKTMRPKGRPDDRIE